ncbi:MAG: DNA polymerase III subunit beta [Rickettsiaceae bacterium]
MNQGKTIQDIHKDDRLSHDNFHVMIEQKRFSHCLILAESILDKRISTASIDANNIKLSAEVDKLYICTTDKDLLFFSQIIPAQIINSGHVNVSTAKLLSNIIKRITDDNINMQLLPNNQFTINGKNCEFNLPIVSVDQFPVMQDIVENDCIELIMPTKEFIRVLDSTFFSASLDENRVNLNGVCFEVKSNKFFAVSTDGHRLSLASLELNEKENANLKDYCVIVPNKTIDKLIRIIKDISNNSANHIKIIIDRTKIKFIINDNIVISKLNDSVFPKYQSFLSRNPYENSLIISASFLLNVIDRVEVVTSQQRKAIKLEFQRECLVVSSIGDIHGFAQEVLQYSTKDDDVDEKSNKNSYHCQFNGENYTSIGFNPKYLTDILNLAKTSKIKLSYKDEFSSVLINILGNDTDNFIVMPFKV